MTSLDLISKIEAPLDAPEPLPELCESPKYPLDALGPLLGEAAKRLAYHVQVPDGMAGQSVLAVASLIAQSHINVRRGSIGVGPVSIFCLSVADSGDRKSTVDRLALSPVRIFEEQRRGDLAIEEKRYQSELASWELSRDSLTKSYSKRGSAMSEDDELQLAEELLNLEKRKPKSPPRANITFSEPTAEGIWKYFIDSDPSAGLFSDEGISFFGGHGMNEESKGRSISMLSKLWDGDPLTRTRGADGDYGILAGCRLTTHLMIQPIIAAKVLADPLLQGQGFFARFLVCHEKTIAGSRFLTGRDLTKGAFNDPAIGRYWGKIDELLRRPRKTNGVTGELELAISNISGKAFEAWCALHDGIEEQLNSTGRFVGVKAFASKAAEHAARIAAILAFIERHEHPAVEHITRAGKLISYYLESMVINTLNAQCDKDTLFATDLLKWINDNGGKLSASQFKNLPNQLRMASTARRVLTFLVASGHLRVIGTNSRSGNHSEWEVFK